MEIGFTPETDYVPSSPAPAAPAPAPPAAAPEAPPAVEPVDTYVPEEDPFLYREDHRQEPEADPFLYREDRRVDQPAPDPQFQWREDHRGEIPSTPDDPFQWREDHRGEVPSYYYPEDLYEPSNEPETPPIYGPPAPAPVYGPPAPPPQPKKQGGVFGRIGGWVQQQVQNGSQWVDEHLPGGNSEPQWVQWVDQQLPGGESDPDWMRWVNQQLPGGETDPAWLTWVEEHLPGQDDPPPDEPVGARGRGEGLYGLPPETQPADLPWWQRAVQAANQPLSAIGLGVTPGEYNWGMLNPLYLQGAVSRAGGQALEHLGEGISAAGDWVYDNRHALPDPVAYQAAAASAGIQFLGSTIGGLGQGIDLGGRLNQGDFSMPIQVAQGAAQLGLLAGTNWATVAAGATGWAADKTGNQGLQQTSDWLTGAAQTGYAAVKPEFLAIDYFANQAVAHYTQGLPVVGGATRAFAQQQASVLGLTGNEDNPLVPMIDQAVGGKWNDWNTDPTTFVHDFTRAGLEVAGLFVGPEDLLLEALAGGARGAGTAARVAGDVPHLPDIDPLRLENGVSRLPTSLPGQHGLPTGSIHWATPQAPPPPTGFPGYTHRPGPYGADEWITSTGPNTTRVTDGHLTWDEQVLPDGTVLRFQPGGPYIFPTRAAPDGGQPFWQVNGRHQRGWADPRGQYGPEFEFLDPAGNIQGTRVFMGDDGVVYRETRNGSNAWRSPDIGELQGRAARQVPYPLSADGGQTFGIQAQGLADWGQARQLQGLIDRMPASLRQLLVSPPGGPTRIIVDDYLGHIIDPVTGAPKQLIAGLGGDQIFLQSGQFASDPQLGHTFYHEFGHFIDNLNGWRASAQPTFDPTAGTAFSPYALGNNAENWAETMRVLLQRKAGQQRRLPILDPALQGKSRLAAQYMQNLYQVDLFPWTPSLGPLAPWVDDLLRRFR